jgi:hypothetical protein
MVRGITRTKKRSSNKKEKEMPMISTEMIGDP